jgi:hypothetical protein
VKIFDLSGKGDNKWFSDPLSNFMFDENMLSFGADNLSLTLNEEGDSYTIKSTVNSGAQVDIKFSRIAPGRQGWNLILRNRPQEPMGLHASRFLAPLRCRG